MEFKEWSNKIDDALKELEELMKTQEEKMKAMPCHEYLKFDKSFNLISKEQYCNVMLILLKLFTLDYNKDFFIFYDEEKKEWKTLIGKDKIDKQKLSEICYEIYYDDKAPIHQIKTLYIIIRRQIKACYKSEFELKPVLVPIDMNLSYIPTVGNFAPSHLMTSSKYGIIDLNYKPDKILKFNIIEDYEGK